MTARNNYWQNVNRLKSPSVFAILSDDERLVLSETIKQVGNSHTLSNPTECYQWASNMITVVNERLNDLKDSHFKMYRR